MEQHEDAPWVAAGTIPHCEMVDPTGVYPFIGEFNPDRVWIARICNAMKLPTSPGAVATFYAAAWESGFTCRRMLAAE